MADDAKALRDILIQHAGEPWDADAALGPVVAWKSPPGLLVKAILRTSAAPMEVLGLLALSCARRALACWDLYCDDSGPARAVEAAESALRFGSAPPDEGFEDAAEPAHGGVPIVDCRECDTGSAADAAAHLVRFVRRRDPLECVYCLSAAEIAFDQSPLGPRDDFHRWLQDVALLAAAERRPLSFEEQEAFRQYSAEDVRAARGEQ